MGAVPPGPLARLDKPDTGAGTQAKTPPMTREAAAYKWVLDNTPCSDKPVSRADTAKVVRELSSRGLNSQQIATVLMAAQASGYKFLPDHPMTPVNLPVVSPDGKIPQTMGPRGEVATPRDFADSLRTSHEWARLSGDTDRMHRIEKEFQQLVEDTRFEEARGGTEYQHGAPLSPADPEADHVRNADGSRPVTPSGEPLSGGGPHRTSGDNPLFNLGPPPGEGEGEAGEAD